ncbi:MAG: hypothetical protein ABI670_18735 [Chloroflexota bacterium]
MRRFMKTQVWLLALIMGLALGMSQAVGAAPLAQADPASLLTAFEKVAFGSAQDTDAALALFTDDAVLSVVPPPAGTSGVWTGKTAIRQALEINKGLHVQRANVGGPQVDGNKATVTSMVTNDNFTLWGVAPVEHSTVVVAEAGKIKSYTSTMALSERARVGAAAAAYQQAHSAPQPAGMPRTGGLDMTLILGALLALGLLSMTAGIAVRKAQSRT